MLLLFLDPQIKTAKLVRLRRPPTLHQDLLDATSLLRRLTGPAGFNRQTAGTLGQSGLCVTEFCQDCVRIGHNLGSTGQHSLFIKRISV